MDVHGTRKWVSLSCGQLSGTTDPDCLPFFAHDVNPVRIGSGDMVSDDGETFPTVFVPQANGIRTFFPDATPDLERNPRCAAPITLPAQR